MSNTNKVVSFTAHSDIVVIGYDGEFADMSNPTGALHGTCAMVLAVFEDGQRRCLVVGTNRWSEQVMPKAVKMASALNNRLANFNKLPVNFDRWEAYHPVYGSAAYSGADEAAWEREIDERC